MQEPLHTPPPEAQLREIAREFRHLRGERERQGAFGRWHRRQGARMARLEERFERVLERSVLDEQLRERWRQHLHHGEPPPEPVVH